MHDHPYTATHITPIGKGLATALCGGSLPSHRTMVKPAAYVVRRQKIGGHWQWLVQLENGTAYVVRRQKIDGHWQWTAEEQTS